MTEKTVLKDISVRVTGNLKFETFLPFPTKIFFQASNEHKIGNLTFTVVNISEKFNANKKHQIKQQQDQQGRCESPMEIDIDLSDVGETRSGYAADAAINSDLVIKDSMILNFEDYEMTKVNITEKNQNQLKKRIWGRICESINISNKFASVCDNFDNINNIYIPAQFIPFVVSVVDSSRFILLTSKNAGKLRSFIYEESEKLQIHPRLLLKSDSADFSLKNIFIQSLNSIDRISLYILAKKNKLHLKSFLEKGFPQLKFEFEETPLAINIFEHRKNIEQKTMFFINRENKNFELLLGFRKCFHTLTKNSNVFHEKVAKMMMDPKEIGDASILNYCSRLCKYRELIGYCIEIAQNTTSKEAVRLINAIVECVNTTWLENQRRQQHLNYRDKKKLADKSDGDGDGDGDDDGNGNEENNGDDDEIIHDTLTVAFVTHNLEKLQELLNEPLSYGEVEIQKDIKEEEKAKKIERRYGNFFPANPDPCFTGMNRTLDFYYKILLFCQNLKKDCDSCFRQSRENRLFNSKEMEYFRIVEGYTFQSNPSSDEKSQLGVQCPLKERIFVNFIMEDGTRKRFTNEILKIRLCCIFDALQKGVLGMNFENRYYHNLIRDFRILWPLKEELKTNNRRYPVFNEKEKCYKLNNFKNLDILLI